MLVNDYFFQGQGQGAGDSILNTGHSGLRFDTGVLRPYLEPRKSDGRMIPVVTLNTGQRVEVKDKDGNIVLNEDGSTKYQPKFEVVRVSDLGDAGVDCPVGNATTLTKDQWIQFDSRVQLALRERLRAYADISAANPMGGFDAYASELLEYETLTDDGSALVDMDGMSDSENDLSHYQLEAIPLPITHSGFTMSKRRYATSQRGGGAGNLLTVRAEHSTRRIAEVVEKTTIGTQAGLKFGNASLYGGGVPQIFGLTNHPQRITKTDLTASAGITGTQMLDNVNQMIDLAVAAKFYGPYVLYTSTGYDNKMRDDFKAESDKTTRQRILELDQIGDIRRLDFLTGDVMVLVQMTSDVIEAINGMPVQVVQWESKGGGQLNFKVMGIQVPFIKRFPGGSTGIVHGTTS